MLQQYTKLLITSLFSFLDIIKMQLHIRGQQTHVLEVLPSETIEVVKVSYLIQFKPAQADVSAGRKVFIVIILESARANLSIFMRILMFQSYQ